MYLHSDWKTTNIITLIVINKNRKNSPEFGEKNGLTPILSIKFNETSNVASVDLLATNEKLDLVLFQNVQFNSD